MSKTTVMFGFYGRRANMELQRPFMLRILAEHPDVEWHLWNLAKDPDDAEYIKDADDNHPRIIVHNQFYGANPWTRFNDVYRHYAQEKYEHCRFVKLDDDVVFIETARWQSFIDTIDESPDQVISAQVINNGACSQTMPDIKHELRRMPIRLLDVHMKPSFAAMSHDYFFNHWEHLVEQDLESIPTSDWLSINLIGYTYEMGVRFAELLGTPSPRHIAGRNFNPHQNLLGDEGMVNTLPRVILQGFLACHLTFGPQERKSPSIWPGLRARYAEINARYLEQW